MLIRCFCRLIIRSHDSGNHVTGKDRALGSAETDCGAASKWTLSILQSFSIPSKYQCRCIVRCQFSVNSIVRSIDSSLFPQVF